MLETVLGVMIGILMIIFLSLFMFIDLIHEYCKKHVDRLEDKQIEIE